jgi:ABC-2 type transport system permease protein
VRAALLIAGKDVRQRLRDRSALLVAIVVLASIFGLIFHDVTSGRVTFAFALVDQDRGEAARRFERKALAPLERRGLITVHREPSLAAGRRAVDEGAIAVLPTGLTTAIRRGGPVAIDVVGDVDAPIGAQVAESIAQSFASRIETDRVARAALGPSAPSPQELGVGPLVLEDISTKSR